MEHACLIDVELARILRTGLFPALKEELLIRTSERRYVNQPQNAENYLCKHLVKMMKMQPESNLGGKAAGYRNKH